MAQGNIMIISKENLSIQNFISFPPVSQEQDFHRDRQEHLKKVLKYINDNDFKNDLILEFGVFKGTSINIIANVFEFETVWGFDSFEGLPEDWVTQKNTTSKWLKGHFATELPDVKNNVRLVKGWFNESLPLWIENNKSKSVKLLHIDSDLYSSAKCILSLLNNQIVKDTVIVFDEMYNWSLPHKYSTWNEGEYKALKEWIDENNRSFEIISRNIHMQCAIKVVS
jgi:hypothetical protein